MKSTFKRVMSFALTLILTFGTVSPLSNIAYAGASLGGGSTTGGGGQLGNNQGGGFDTHLESLNFRVSVQRTPELYNDGSQAAKDKVLNNFSYKYPNEWDSEVYFLNHKCTNSGNCYYTANLSNYRITKYDSSSGVYKDYNTQTAKNKIFGLKNVNSRPANLYKSALQAYSYHNANKKDIIELADGKWKSIANSKSVDEALNVWSYILYPTGSGSADVNNRMSAYVSAKASGIEPNSEDVDKEDVALGYLDLLMSMWRLNSSKNNESTSYWEQAIEDYIKVSDPEERPITIVIDLVGNMKHSPNATDRFLIPMIDYFQLYTGIRSGQDFKNITSESVVGTAKGKTKSILETIVNKARADHPNSWGNNFSDQWSKSTWNWGSSAIMAKGKRFITYNRKPAHYNNSSAQHAIMESLYLGDDPAGIWGFTAVGFQVNDMAPAEVGFKLIATPDNEIVDYKSEVIGKQVTLDLQVSDVDSKAVNAWESILKRADNGSVNIKLHIKRDGSFNKGKYTFTDGDYTKGLDIPVSSFISMLRGNKQIKWFDDTTQEVIAEAQKKVFTYEVKVEVNWTIDGKTNQWLSTDFSASNFTTKDTASFIRPEAPPDPMYYNNYPLQYAEVKEGTPDNESFEAMSGVPSTERLYFGAGGVEFVIDVELEYEKDKESVWRTYRSFFSGVSCEHKSGDQCPITHNYTPTPNKSETKEIPIHGSTPPPPAWYGNDEAHGYKEYSHTAVSDLVTREGRETISYNESVTDPKCGCDGHGEDSKGNPKPCPKGGHCLDAPGSVTWSSSVSSIAHMGCGPCHNHELPTVNDTWKQNVNIDFIKINKVEVYRLTEGRLTPVNAIFGDSTTELRTTSSTTPTLFYNIAQMNAGGNDVAAQSSLHGRLRYTLEPQMHDTVVWDEGTRTNKCDGSTGLGQGHFNAQGIAYNTTAYSDELNYHVTNSTNYDKARPEWKKFDERRKLKNNVTMISDVLIMQTSSGDKCAMYFTKEGVEITAQEQFADINATKLEMWDSNPTSASRWSDNEIPLGSYNGNFTKMGVGSANNQKYWGYGYDTKQFYQPQGLGQVSTIFDNDPAGTISRPGRPGKLYMFKDAQIVKTNQNKLYNTGDASVFYERILSWECPNPYDDDPYVQAGVQLRPLLYDASPQGSFGGRVGIVEDAYYSPNHVKVNDIIIHTPVSTEDAMIIGLPSDRDQRTETPPGGAESLIEEQNKLKICPLNPETCDFKVLNCEFLHEKDMASFDFDSRNGSNLLNKVTNLEVPYRIGSGMSISPKSGFGNGDVLHVTGTRFSFNLSDIGIAYDKTMSYLIEMDFLMPETPKNDGTMVLSFGEYAFLIPKDSTVGGFTTNTSLDTRVESGSLVGTPIKLGIQFSLGHILDSKLFINGVEQTNVVKIRDTKVTEDSIGTTLNIGSWGKSDNFGGTFYIDNLKITKASGGTDHSNACYVDAKVHGVIKNHEHVDSCYSTNSGKYACNGLPLNTGGSGNSDSQSFAFRTAYYSFNVPHTGDYVVELWGAEGGTSGYGGKGGYVKGTITLQEGDILYVYVGGQSGWNGGGSGHGRATDSGGGATDIRLNGTSLSDRIAVAGGGGGWGGSASTIGGDGGGTVGGSGKAGYGTAGTGGGQSYGGTGGVNYGQDGTLGLGGSNTGGSNSGGGGGGGGYYGGGAGGNDYPDYNDLDDSSGGGGSSYVAKLSSVTNTRGVNSGNGKATISWETEPEPLGHTHNSSCPKVTTKSLICDYTSELNVVTENNSHSHDASCGTYNGWSCYNLPLNSNKVYTCNNLPLNDVYKSESVTFNYTGSVQTYTAPADATYTLEVWGAQGTSRPNLGTLGGYGGYSKGDITLRQGDILRVYVGGHTGTSVGGWNGGGSTGGSAGGGGGATDIRLGGTALTDRIIVAGGGGGAQAGYGGDGGGLIGGDGEDKLGSPGLGGTQTLGGTGGGNQGTLGYGGNGVSGSDGNYGGAGGGGYYGGGGASSDHSLVDDSGGGGGSGYIGGVTNATTQAGAKSGPGKAVITAPTIPTAHKHTASCNYEYSGHTHTSSCSSVKEYSCGGQVKNSHTDVSNYVGGNRTYGAFENVGSKILTTNGIKTDDGYLRITGNQVINGPSDEYYAGTYLVTIKGNNVHNANITASGNNKSYAISNLNTSNSSEVKYVLGVTDKTDSLNFTISTNIGVVDVSEIFVQPITVREPIGLCTTCKKHVTLKAGGTKVQCSECSTDLFDFEEKINFMSGTNYDANGNRQITVLGAGNKVAILRVENGYQIDEALSYKADNKFESYFKHEKALSNACGTALELGCTEPHHSNSHYDGGNDICWDACGLDDNHKVIKDEVVDPITGTVMHNATFINLDYGFRMYFPNIGDFAEDTNLKGITAPTSTRGYGYIDDMPTTKYTERKSVTFEFNVIHKGVLYLAGERIDLTVEEEYFDFYCVLANREALGASVEWEAVAINARPIGNVKNDNYIAVSNKQRYGDFTALHGGYKQTWIDVVGRIGNYVISDTDDFRFSNFFKEADVDSGWLIEGILPKVRQDSQNKYYGDLVDIRGEVASENTNYLNTYGSQKWLEQQPISAPINPKDNPVPQLREKFMRVGYDIYSDITTIGDYQDGTIRALPYYYLLDLDTNSLLPLDVYMKENDNYLLINSYSAGDDNTIPTDIYYHNMIMNWEKESARRNYMIEESLITDKLADMYRAPVVSSTTDEDGNVVQGVTGWLDMERPKGSYTYQGIAQRHVLTSTSKTYIGSSKTYGDEKNIGGIIADNVWEDNVQRWHLKFGLPSSGVFVETGKEPTQENIDDLLNRNGVVINAMDIISIGKTYTLRWQQPGITSFTVEKEGNRKTYNIKNLGLPPVIALYEAGKTSVDDITILGTH